MASKKKFVYSEALEKRLACLSRKAVEFVYLHVASDLDVDEDYMNFPRTKLVEDILERFPNKQPSANAERRAYSVLLFFDLLQIQGVDLKKELSFRDDIASESWKICGYGKRTIDSFDEYKTTHMVLSNLNRLQDDVDNIQQQIVVLRNGLLLREARQNLRKALD